MEQKTYQEEYGELEKDIKKLIAILDKAPENGALSISASKNKKRIIEAAKDIIDNDILFHQLKPYSISISQDLNKIIKSDKPF